MTPNVSEGCDMTTFKQPAPIPGDPFPWEPDPDVNPSTTSEPPAPSGAD